MLAVTGATGFVGRHVCVALDDAGMAFRPITRTGIESHPGIGEIGPDTSWRGALSGVSCIIHLAARVHHMREETDDPVGAYRRTNRDGTLRMAREAADCGVRRIVFVSTVKVNGEVSDPGCPFRADDVPRPEDPYALSKWEAEQGLHDLAKRTGLEVVVVRPPLVYGAGVGANFRSLVALVRSGLPLPLASIRNRRSLIAAENLADLLVRCAIHPAARGGTFLCSDGEDVSTPELLRAVGNAMRVPVRLFPVPPWALRAAGGLLGRGAAMGRLVETLQVDAASTRSQLEWTPRFSMRQALARAADSRWSSRNPS